jgi:small subunit ribosomal protein S16
MTLSSTFAQCALIFAICLNWPLSAILRCCVLCGRAFWSGLFFGGLGRVDQPPLERLTKTIQDLDFERNRIAVVMIRLARFGARKQPYYRIVVIEKDRARNGRSIEVVGHYNPRTTPATVDLKYERVAYWRGVGAQFSSRVEKLVAQHPAPVAEPAAA